MSRVPWNLGRGPVSICQWSPAEWCTGSAATCRSSEARRAGRCRWPFTRRNCLDASTMPAAHQRSPICPSRQRLTLRAWSRLIEIIDSKLSCQTAAVEGMELARARSSASFHIRRMMTLASGRLWARRAARLVLFSSARRRSGSRCRRWTGWPHREAIDSPSLLGAPNDPEGQNRCQNPFKPRHRRWADHRREVVDGSLVGKASSPERQYECVNDDRHEQEQETSCDCGKTGAQDATHPDSLRTVVHTVARLSCSHSVLAMTRGPAETTVVSSR